MVETKLSLTDELQVIVDKGDGLLIPEQVVAWAETHPQSALRMLRAKIGLRLLLTIRRSKLSDALSVFDTNRPSP